MNEKIRSFFDLDAWKDAHNLVLAIYEITKKFPKEEIFALVIQIKRAAVSVSSNIAEGFSRSSFKDKIHFYYMALGSLTEIQNQLRIAKDVKYISSPEFDVLFEQTIKVSKIINGLIRKSKSFIPNS